MLSSIVIPLDGSDLSESALPVGSEIARALGAPVTLLTSGWGSTVEELEHYLQARAARVTANVTTSVVPDTFPATAISHTLTEGGVVVMGTHGRSGLGKVLLGSVAMDVVKGTDQPVVLIGPATSERGPLPGGLMIVAVDGSASAATIVACAGEWAEALSMSVTVVAAGDPAELGPTVSAVADRLRAGGTTVAEEVLDGRDPARSIVEAAGRLRAGLVAMSTRGDGAGRTPLGSTASKVVHDAACPVLVQQPPA